jgi:hypothetical protein
MNLTSDQVAAMAFLSWAAYDYSYVPDPFDAHPVRVKVSAQDNLNSSGWTALNLTDPQISAIPLPTNYAA